MASLEIVLILGAISGSIYALLGLSLVVLYRSTRVINFAQGDVATVGLYVGLVLLEDRVPYWLAAVMVVLTGAALSGVIGVLFATRWFARRSPVGLVIATVGAALIIQGVASSISGGQTYTFPSLGSQIVLRLSSVTVTVADLTAFLLSAGVFAAIAVLFKTTVTGKGMRAMAEDEEEARALGLPVGLLKNASWLLAGGLAALSGLFVAPVYSLSPGSVDVLVVYGFAVVVVGGFESSLGAAVLGLAVGMVQSVVGIYVSASYVIPLLVGSMVVALVIKPTGVFGRARANRV